MTGGPAILAIDAVKVGDLLRADGGFTCLNDGELCLVHEGPSGGLYVECRSGQHFLDGQINEAGTAYTGFWMEKRA